MNSLQKRFRWHLADILSRLACRLRGQKWYLSDTWCGRAWHDPASGNGNGVGMNEPRKCGHDGDCTIYAALSNGSPTDGICTCGYGWQMVRKGSWDDMYSIERLKLKHDAFARLEAELKDPA